MAERQANQKEELVRIYNNKEEGRFGFIYNDHIVLTQNKDYAYIQAAPITLSTTDNITLLAHKLGIAKPVRLTFTFETDTNGNISSVNAKETSYQKVEVTQQDGVDKDLFNTIYDLFKPHIVKEEEVPPLLTVSAMSLKNPFFKYLINGDYNAFTTKVTRQHLSILKRASFPMILATLKKKDTSLATKFSTLISQVENGSKIVVNLEKGNIVYQNNTRYTIIEDNSLKAVDNNNNEVTLNQDDLEKEITPCNLINWKIKL